MGEILLRPTWVFAPSGSCLSMASAVTTTAAISPAMASLMASDRSSHISGQAGCEVAIFNNDIEITRSPPKSTGNVWRLSRPYHGQAQPAQEISGEHRNTVDREL